MHGVSVSFATHQGMEPEITTHEEKEPPVFKRENTQLSQMRIKQTNSVKWKMIVRLEMPGIEPGAFHMQSERSTTELHPPHTIPCHGKEHIPSIRGVRYKLSDKI